MRENKNDCYNETYGTSIRRPIATKPVNGR